MQNLIGIRISDAAHDPRVRQRAFQSSILNCERSLKRFEIAGENIDAARIYIAQALLALEQVKGSAALRAGFGKHQRAVRKIESRKLISSSQLCSRDPPVQTSRNHQMQNEPQVSFKTNCNALSDAPQFAHLAPFNTRKRRFHRAQQKWARQANMLNRLADNARFESGNISGDVWKFWHPRPGGREF